MISIAGITPAFLASFFISLLSQLNDPNHLTHLDYKFSPDFLYHKGITFEDGVETPINSACEDGPSGKIPPMDFIIVGAGAAGSVLANKIATTFPKKTVLLIEAGGDGYVNVVAPGLTFYSYRSDINWKYHAEINPNYGNVIEEGALTFAGKGLGGGTSMNAMYFVCGTDVDYDYWAEVSGDDTWNAENIFKNIKEFTKITDESLLSDPDCAKVYGTNGPVTVASWNVTSPNKEYHWLMKAGEAAGFKTLKDINCGKWIGFTQYQATIDKGERVSSARAFLAPMRNKKNLMILRNSFVKNLIIKNGEVEGVLVQTNRKECREFSIRANHEVILSAGTFNSAAILLRSGIGRKGDLDEINVPQVLDLPVGHNYRDHLMSLHYIQIPAEPQTPAPSNRFEEYLQNRTGSLGNSQGSPVYAFINLKNDSDVPNLKWAFNINPAGTFSYQNVIIAANYKEKYYKVLEEVTKHNDILVCNNENLTPKSSGQIKTRDNRPIIHGNYNSHPDDVQTMLDGIRRIEAFVDSPMLKSLNASMINMNLTECDNFEFRSDEYWKCYIKFYSSTTHHQVGTNRMGKSDDKDAVVDSKLKVIGAKGKVTLRVVDASVIPEVPRAHTMCPVYAVAWNAAKIIIKDNLNDDGDGNTGFKLEASSILLFVTILKIFN